MADPEAPRLSLAGVHEVDRIWPLVADGLERACRKTGGGIDANYLWSECRSGAAFLIVIASGTDVIGASVWRFEKWTSGKKLKCLALYGRDMKSWLAEHERLTFEMARVGGAQSILTEGRTGWKAKYPKARILHVLYELDLP